MQLSFWCLCAWRLADLISDKGWSKDRWRRPRRFKPEHSMVLDSKSNQGDNSIACYLLICESLYSGMGARVIKMKAICFNIVSHSLTLFTVDQEHMKDTWFNAAIVRNLMYSKHKIERTQLILSAGR